MDIFSPTIIDNAIITGSNNASLLQVSSPSATSAFFISGSGNVGIGTGTPTNTLQVVGGITATSITASIISASIGITGSLNVLNGNIKINNSYKILGDSNHHLTTYNYDSNFPPSTSASFGLVNIGGVGSYITAREDYLFGSSTMLQFFTLGSERARITAGGRLGINTTTPGAILVVKGDSALSSGVTFQALNSSDTTLLYVRDDGNVGIGTSSPTARLHISGANNGALLIASSSTAPSALFVSGSGNVGVGTTTPGVTLDVVGQIRASSTMFNSTTQTNTIQLSSATNLQFLSASVETARYDNNGWGFFNTTPTARVHISGADSANLFRISSPSVTNALFVTGSGNVGIGTNLPSADLHISGASADSLLRVGSPTNSDIFFVNGNGRVGINTTSSTSFLGGSNISTFTIFQNSGSGDGLTPAIGLQVVNSGSSTSAQAQLSIVTVGDKFAAFNIGTSGSGTQNNYWHLSKRNAAASHALNLYNNNNGTFSSNPLFSFIAGGTSTLGENTQIIIDDANARVGLQTIPSDFINLYSFPAEGNYIRIDAEQTSNSPPLTAATAKTGYGITTNDYFLAEPDYWMEIKLAANVVLIPCYLPA